MLSRRPRIVAISIVIGLAAAAVYVGTRDESGISPTPVLLKEAIVFERTSFEPGAPFGEAWVIDPGTRQTRRLLKSRAVSDTDVSPDGRSVVYSQWNSIDGTHITEGLFVQDLLTGRVRRLDPRDPQPDWAHRHRSHPRWSPDGRKVVFSVGGAVITSGGFNRAESDIYVMNEDGTGVRKLSPEAEALEEWGPDWSPDGRSIVFLSDPTGKRFGTLTTMRSDGSERRGLTRSTRADAPAWSPSGNLIAYEDSWPGPRIVTVRPDGTSRAVVVAGKAPSWSADGRRIVFHRWLAGQNDIYVVNADGSGLRKLVAGPSDDSNPRWDRIIPAQAR